MSIWRRRRGDLGLTPAPVRRRRAHLALNLAVALLAWVLASTLADTPWLRGIEDRMLGLVMDLYRGTDPDPAGGLVLVSVDTATWRDWGEPPVLPRARLLALLQAAERLRPAAIVVGLELLNPEPGPHEPLSNGDRALLAWLNDRADDPSRPPLILIRPLRTPVDATGQPQARRPLQAQRTFLEEQGLRPSDQLLWAAAMFDRGASGETLYWRLVELACADGPRGPRWTLLPSAALVAAMLQGRVDAPQPGAGVRAVRQLVEDLQQRLAPTLAGRDCAAEQDLPLAQWMQPLEGFPVLLDPGTELRLSRNDLSRRILYRIPGAGSGFGPRAYHPDDPLLDPARADDLAAGLPGRVVLIGNAHEGAGDLHQIPIGPMPGLYVIGNAVRTLTQAAVLDPLPGWVQLPLLAVLVVLVSLVFLWLDSFWGKLACTLGLVLLLAPLSVLMFRWGVWLNLAIPVLAVQLTEWVSEWREALSRSPH